MMSFRENTETSAFPTQASLFDSRCLVQNGADDDTCPLCSVHLKINFDFLD